MINIIESGAPRVYSLSGPFGSWDGRWLAILVTIPHRSARRPLYSGLTWAGLGNPVPGLWLGPQALRAQWTSAVRQRFVEINAAWTA